MYYRIFMELTEEQFKELFEHLKMNGYTCWNQWVTDNCIEIDYDEFYEVKTILDDRNIDYQVK